jgi:hypothetical protein
MSQLREQATPTDLVPLVPELAADQMTSDRRVARHRRLVYWALALMVFLVTCAPFVMCIDTHPRQKVREAPVAQNECFRYTHVSEGQQPASGCERALAGNCSTAPGVCVAFAFLSDTNASSVISGSMYRCGDPTCTNVGDACRCANPALGRVIAFCRRHVAGKEYGGANFACY